MRIPDTHEHTCAICKAEYVSHSSINWRTCDNCQNRAKQYILEETQYYDPEEIWKIEANGNIELQEETECDLYDQLLEIFKDKFQINRDTIDDNCQDTFNEIINNNTPRPISKKESLK